jgi:hypothetical protein
MKRLTSVLLIISLFVFVVMLPWAKAKRKNDGNPDSGRRRHELR